jgi:hypothetical protein
VSSARGWRERCTAILEIHKNTKVVRGSS